MSSNWSFMINGHTRKDKTKEYVDVIEQQLNQIFSTDDIRKKYFQDVQWKYRLNGRDIRNGNNKYLETMENGKTIIFLIQPSSRWETWVSTIGILHRETEQVHSLDYKSVHLKLYCETSDTSVKITFETMEKTQVSIRLMHLIRNALYKAAYCIGCKACEVECPPGAIRFIDGKITIKGCVHCENCLERTKGCIVAESHTIPIGGTNMMKKGMAGYQTRGLRQDWLGLYFDLGTDFWGNDRLGKNMFLSFKAWIKEAGLINGLSKTPLGEKLSGLGADNVLVWSTIFINLAYESPLINWYVKTLYALQPYDNSTLKSLLGEQYSISIKDSAISSLKETFKASPIGKVLGVGDCEMKGNAVISITKKTWHNPEPLAILYSLFKFAEASDRYYSFTLTDLLADSPERSGISPEKLFNISRETLQQILFQLSHDYSGFIKVVFNKDLDNIYLSSEKTSLDVAGLF
jgi:phosphoadenosine phosphosulfate reductase